MHWDSWLASMAWITMYMYWLNKVTCIYFATYWYGRRLSWNRAGFNLNPQSIMSWYMAEEVPKSFQDLWVYAYLFITTAPSLFHRLPTSNLTELIPTSADCGCFSKLCRVSQGFPISLSLLDPSLSVPYFWLLLIYLLILRWLGGLNTCGF